MANITTILESLRPVIEQLGDMRPLLPTYAHLIVSALVPIYTGSHASLSRPSSAAKPKKATRDEPGAEDEDEDEDEDDKNQVGNKMEGLEPTDALIFPLMAGLTLGGLYLIIKWLKDPAILNKILSFYFSQMGLFFASALLRDGLKVLRSYIFPTTFSAGGYQLKVIQSKRLATAVTKAQNTDHSTSIERKSPLPGPFGAITLPATVQNGLWDLRTLSYQRIRLRAKALRLFKVKMRFDLLDITAALISLLAVTYFAFFAKPWWLTNFLGFAFCYGSLQVISPSTFTTGSLILSSLFLYDIYFVFFTPLMVTVATKLDVPIKMVFPRPAGPSEDPSEVSLAMLGLGDIVVPGMMIGLALRFDLFLYYKYKSIAKSTKGSSTKEGPDKAVYQPATGRWGERFWSYSVFSKSSASESSYSNAVSFPKPYFYASVGGYVVGMVATLIAMQFSNHAQPALLYLVPGVLVSLWGTAYFRNELGDMWSFSDMTEDEKPQEKAQPDQAKEKIHTATKAGLFQRIWSGDLKAQSHSRDPGEDQKLIDKKSPADDEEKPEVKTRDFALAKSDDGSETCIFSMSISIPRPKS